MKFVKMKKLFENGLFVGDCVANYAIVSCELMSGGTPKICWLKREQLCCGDNGVNYTLTFADPSDADALVGVWITQDGKGVMVDAADLNEILAECEKCCDGDAVEPTTTYTDDDGLSTFPAITGGAVVAYCITRADDGSIGAQQKFDLDYYGRYKTAKLFSASGTSSKYDVTSVAKPTVVLTDTIATAVCS